MPASSPAPRILQAARPLATGTDSLQLLKTLGVLYEIEGRTEEMRGTFIEAWRDTDSPATLVKKLARQDTAPVPVGSIRKLLETPRDDDDRVWLGRANLATRTGQLDLAARLLDDCLRRRPDDPVVWKARLELAQAAGDFVAAWRALQHLPAAGFSDVDLARIRAWLAAGEGDIQAERAALLALVERDPGNTTALDRLAALSASAGKDQEAARFRSKRAEVTAAKERYQLLLRDGAVGSDPAELRALPRVWAEASRQGGGPCSETVRSSDPDRRGRLWFRRAKQAPLARLESRRAACSLSCAPTFAPGNPRRPAAGSSGVALDTLTMPRLPGCDSSRITAQLRPEAAARDHERGRGPARLRRRRLARRLCRPGRALPASPTIRPMRATACSATAATGPSRTSPSAPACTGSRAATATASPSATTTTTAIPTCSSRDGGPTPCSATGATERSRT